MVKLCSGVARWIKSGILTFRLPHVNRRNENSPFSFCFPLNASYNKTEKTFSLSCWRLRYQISNSIRNSISTYISGNNFITKQMYKKLHKRLHRQLPVATAYENTYTANVLSVEYADVFLSTKFNNNHLLFLHVFICN